MGEQKHWFKNSNHVGNQNNMRLSGKLCDVTIKVNNKEFQAHKVILASNLKYFESMFLNSFQESKQDVITMQDVRETDLEAFIMYAYTGKILLTENNTLNLFELANYLSEDSIKEACVNFLKIHLKKEDACVAYKLANSTECLELKNVTKRLILLNFKDCSLTAEYLSLDFESLKDILLYNTAGFVQSQQILFEGIVRWILHDTQRRRPHVNDILNQIKITKVKPDYLLQYFCECIEDQCDTVKDIMIFYRTKSKKMLPTESLKQRLMILGYFNAKHHFQFFDLLEEKKWSPLGVIANLDRRLIDRGTIFNNTVYYTTYDLLLPESDLRLFNPTSEQTIILTTDRRLLRRAAICADTNFLYFCGGCGPNRSESGRIVTYEPGKNVFEILPSMQTPRSSAASIFFQECLFVVGGSGSSGIEQNTVEKYDPYRKTWTVEASMRVGRYNHAVAVLYDKLYACGGVDENSVEVYDPVMNSWQLVASMNMKRHCFLLVAYEGKLLAIGGGDGTIEVYDPIKNHWRTDVEMASGLKKCYPRGGWIFNSI